MRYTASLAWSTGTSRVPWPAVYHLLRTMYPSSRLSLPNAEEGQWERVAYESEKRQEFVTGFTMKRFAAWLAQFYKGTIDRTGLTGRYDFVLDYRNDDPAVAASPSQRLTIRPEALGQIGLKLAAIKAPLEFIVVDQLEKDPAEN